MTCKHEAHRVSEPRCYRGSVNPHNEFPAAHGNIEVTETCKCGHMRLVNINMLHREEGPWGPPAHVAASLRTFNRFGHSDLGHGVSITVLTGHARGISMRDMVRVTFDEHGGVASVDDLLLAADQWAGEGNACDLVYGLVADALRPCLQEEGAA